MRKRVLITIMTIFIFMAILIGRLIQLQLVSTESFTKQNINLIASSVMQRTEEFVIEEGRGRFVDRNGESLTDETFPSLVLFPFLNNMTWPTEKVADILNIPASTIINTIKDAKKPIIFGESQPLRLTEAQMKEINDLKFPGLFAVYKHYKLTKNYGDHLIGLLGENEKLFKKRYPDKQDVSSQTNIGITGLQSAFDEFLLAEGERKLMYHVDGNGGPLFGIEVKYSEPANPYYPIVIKTTLDKKYQKAAEDIITKFGLVEGGLVLLDIENSEVLASVSAPSINLKDPFGDGSAKNRMVIPQFPGSVFKTVIAAAAIEKNIVSHNRYFDCNLNLYGEPSTDYRYGQLNFKESFARSCNYTFATLAQELMANDDTVIEEYADKLGLIRPVGWSGNVFRLQDFTQLPEEYHGKVWGDELDKSARKAIAQTAIGQKEVKVTPLAIANMMATIARGGKKMEVKAVSEVLYKNGTTLFTFPDQPLEGDNIAPYTAMRLQQLLREVVKSDVGTGRRFQTLPYEVAGKSGTAETGKMTSNSRSLTNKWFAGYFPMEQPRYALVVVDLNQDSQKAVTNDVFYEYVKKIYELDTE